MSLYYTATYSGEIEIFSKKKVLFTDIYSPDGTFYRDHVCIPKKYFASRSLQQRIKSNNKARRKIPTCDIGTKIVFMAVPYEYEHLGETKRGLREIRNLMDINDYKG